MMKKEPKNKINYAFSINNFATYGLNRYRNFLKAPECECGCGAKGRIVVDDRDALYDFMAQMVLSYDCEEPAVFAVAQNGDMIVAMREYDDKGEPTCPICVGKGYNFFSKIDGDVHFCCYGLLMEQEDGTWEICE
jgi:hypothetical protein